jgi:hypothetical protein
MTLSSNCLSAEPSATPGDPLTGFGTRGQAPATALTGTRFASLLTQADATGLAGEPVLAAATTPEQSAVKTTVLYPAAYCVSGVGSTPIPAVGEQVAGTTKSEGEKPGMPFESQVPTLYQENCFQPGSQTVPLAVPNAVPVQIPTQAASSEVLVTDGSITTKEVDKKSEAPRGSLPKEKQKSPAKSEDSSSADSEQNAMLLAYQFIAGQWVPQPVVPTAVPELNSTLTFAAQTSSNALPDTPSVGLGMAPFQNSQPGPEQKAGQKITGPITVQTSEKATPPPTGAVSSGENTTAVSRPDEKSPFSDLPGTKVSDGVLLPTQEKTDLAAVTDSVASGTQTQIPGTRITQSRTELLQAPEKFAASNTPNRSGSASGVNPSNSKGERKSLSIDNKELTSEPTNVGTGTANREIAMPYSAVNKSPAVEFSTIVGDGVQAKASAEAPVAAQASRLVQEIRQIADRISVIDRNSVDVRFDFSATERLSVRVEYRDGTVHTTFRTDSSQLRDAISHEWQAQSAAAEQRPYRMSEPVFSQTTSDRQNSSFSGGGSGRQNAFEHPVYTVVPSPIAAGRNTGTTPSAAVPAGRSYRPETSLRLHTFA